MEDFQSAAQAYFNDEKFSDLVVVCAPTGKTFKSHRFLLSVHSKWFERCCASEFSESASRRVELKGDIPAAVDKMMEFFYKFDYGDEVPHPGKDDEEEDVQPDPAAEATIEDQDTASIEIKNKLELHSWMYAIGEKYEVSGLKKLALQKFITELRTRNRKQRDLKAIIKLIYDELPLPESDPKLRNIIVSEWIFVTVKDTEKMNPHELLAFHRKLPLFAADVSLYLISGINWADTSFTCAGCEFTGDGEYLSKTDQIICGNCEQFDEYSSAMVKSAFKFDRY